VTANALKISWLGHSTVLIELDGVRLLTDPVLRTRFAHLRRVVDGADAAVGALDATLISHLHYDHLDVSTLKRLGRSQHLVVPAGAAGFLRKRGFTHVDELERGGELVLGDVTIQATHAVHEGRRLPFGAEVPALGYLVTGSARVYFAGDTDLFDEMVELAPGLDVALLPIAGWGLSVPAGHLDPLRAAQALELLSPRYAVPIHWGTYRLVGLRDSLARRPPEAFLKHARELAPDVEVCVLPVGGSLRIDVPARRVQVPS
jgi:L-ascorbate metabolism protein UlaG (beta-lactamase superfamily)